MLYLDHAASSPPFIEAIEAAAETSRHWFANPSSPHRLGGRSEQLLRNCKERIATWFAANASEIILTSGGSESNNLAIKGVLQRSKNRAHIITTAIEHASIFELCRKLEARQEATVTYLPVDRNGRVSPQQIIAAIRPDTVLISLHHIHSETGAIQPIAEIGEKLRAYPKLRFHVDAVQSIGKLNFPAAQWGVDLFSASAHKFGGVRGAGFLYVRRGIELEPQLVGGGQEAGYRSGTVNLAAAVAMGKALRLCYEQLDQRLAYLYKVKHKLSGELDKIGEVTVHPGDAPHILHMSCPGYNPEIVIRFLEAEEIYISSRSACSSKDTKPSRTLIEMGCSEEEANSGLRVSWSVSETEANIDLFISALQESLKSIKSSPEVERSI